MNDIDIEEYNNNIIQELNAAEEEGECSLSIFLHDLIEIDIESNFSFNYNVIDRIIDICTSSLSNNMPLLAHECMYFVRYCINKCINIKEEINENFLKKINVIIDICLSENKFSDDSFLLFERTFFFFILDLNNVTCLIDIWKNYSIELNNFSKSLLHIISFHLCLLNDILNNLKVEDIDINYIQKGYSRIKIIEIASDLLLYIFQNTEEIQNINNCENYINIILKEYEHVPDIEIKKKILSLFKSIHKFILDKKIDNFSFCSQIYNLINKKRNYYLTLSKEKDINIDYLKDNSYIYVNNSSLFVKTFSDSVEENTVSSKAILTPNGYKGSLLMNIFYAYFYNTKNKLLMVLSYDRIRIKNEKNTKTVIFHFKKNDAIGVLSNKLRKKLGERFLDNIEVSINFSTESIKEKVYDTINCIVKIENFRDDDDEKIKEDGESIYLKDNLYTNKLKNDIDNNDSNNDIIKNTNNKSKEKVEGRKVSFATTKEICLLNDNISVETKTMLLEESLNNLGYNDNELKQHDKNFELKKLVNNDIADALFNESINANESTVVLAGGETEKKAGNLKISYATTKDLIKENYIYDDMSKDSDKFYSSSINEALLENENNLNNTFNGNNYMINNDLFLNNENHQKDLSQINSLEKKKNQQDNILNNYDQNQNITDNGKNSDYLKKQISKEKNVEMDIHICANGTNEKEIKENRNDIKNNDECEKGDEEDIINKNCDNNDTNIKKNFENTLSEKYSLSFRDDMNKNINEKNKMLKISNIENIKTNNFLQNNIVNKLKSSIEKKEDILNNSQNICLKINGNIPKSPVEIVKELLNYDEKQKNINECIQSLNKYDKYYFDKIKNQKNKNDIRNNKLINDGNNKRNEEKTCENIQRMDFQECESYYEKTTNAKEICDKIVNKSEINLNNVNIDKTDLIRENTDVQKTNKNEDMEKNNDKKNNNISATKEYSEIVNILGNDEPSNEIILNNEKAKEDDLKESCIDKCCLSSKNKKRITTNIFDDKNNDDYYSKNNIDSPYPIKKVKFNNYDAAFLDLLKKEDNLENLSAKYLIKAYTLIQYNKRYIHIQIIDYFRYIRKEILLSYEKINMKYSNLLNELQLEYEIKFQNIISKYSNRLITKKKNINMNVPKPIDLNLIKEKLNALYDTFSIVQRTIKNKISNSKILMKYKQSDIYTPSFSLATIISKYST